MAQRGQFRVSVSRDDLVFSSAHFIHVAKDAEVVRVSVDGQPRYVFPLSDCALLPVPKTTVEMLAELLAETARRWRADRNTGQVRRQRLVTAGLASGRCRLPVLVLHLLHFTVRLHIAFGVLFR